MSHNSSSRSDGTTDATDATVDRRRPVRTLIVLALVMAALFVRQRHSDIIPGDEQPGVENFVDTYIVKVQSEQFDENGNRIRTMQADLAAHYARSDETLLKSPSIETVTDTGKRWQTSARNGKVQRGGTSFDLWNTVLIEQVDGDAVARTDSLTYHSADGRAETSKEVVIDSRIGQTVGVGMNANLNTETLQLHSEVRSVFDAP